MNPYREPGEIASRPGPGGTSGGTAEFLIGLALLIAGGYLFLDHVQVTSRVGSLWGFGYGSFGLSLLPVFIGIALLFFNGRSVAGWVLTAGGLIIIMVGVISRLAVHWRTSSLYEVLVILALIAAGIGLIARSLRDHRS
jgi:hypothetical protein